MCCPRSTALTLSASTTAGPTFLDFFAQVGEWRTDLGEPGPEELRGGPEPGPEIADAERPMMRHAGGTPGVGPLARVAVEIDPGGGVPDPQQRPRHDRAGRGDEAERAAALRAETERGDWPGPDVELHRDAPAALAVVDPETPQERAARGDLQVGGTVMAHLDHVVGEVERLQLGERAAAAEPVGDQHGQRGAQLVLAAGGYAPRGQQRRAQDHARPQPLVLLAVQAAVVIGQAVEA